MAPRLTNLDPIDRSAPPGANPLANPLTVNLEAANDSSSLTNGVLSTKNPDGSMTIDFAPKKAETSKNDDFYRNLADEIDEGELARIASEIIEGVTLDIQSRREWLENRRKGVELLGLKLEVISGEANAGDGISRVRHPLLLDTVLRFQANARGELLPAGGPVKVRNDTTMHPRMPVQPPTPPQPPPQPPQNGPNPSPVANPAAQIPMRGGMVNAPGQPSVGLPHGAPPPAPAMPPQQAGPSPAPGPAQQAPAGPPTGLQQPPAPAIPDGQNDPSDEMAQALETDFNHYLTAVATEYYPDTDRMLFWVGAGGQSVKKVYNCPIRRRPISESIDIENLVVNDTATDLQNAQRITHIIKMQPSWLKRMQIVGAYRDVDLTVAPSMIMQNPVEKEVSEITGVNPQPQRVGEQEHEIYECYCELDIDGFEHKEKGKVTGLRLPYVVTLHKESRQVLEVRRNWEEDDKLCLKKEYFVDFSFVKAIGFYAIGLINILGNTTMALTAAWRLMLDKGMFANFPGFVYQKQFGHQLTNEFRVPPGGGVPIDTGGADIRSAIMPIPYSDIGANFAAFVDNVATQGKALGGAADIQIGEGKQDVPVGTVLAVIEQATKVMDAVHKRLHSAQAKEFQLLKERFKEDPEAFWRFNKRPAMPWKIEQFLKALDDNNLVPVADPNNPTSMHRIAKGAIIQQLAAAKPALYDPIAVDVRTLRIAGIDPQGLFRATPAPDQPDPGMVAAQAKMQANQMQQQANSMQMQLKFQIAQLQSQDKAADRASRERVEQMKIVLERLRILEERLIHGEDENGPDENETMQQAAQLLADQYQHNQSLANDRYMAQQQQQHDRQVAGIQAATQRHVAGVNAAADMAQHRSQLEHDAQQAELDRQNAVAVARAKPKPKPSGSK